MTPRLAPTGALPTDVLRPRYTPSDHGTGIVHLGLGAFHKAHQAVYTDDALGAAGGNWRITGVSLRSPAARDALAPQNGLYTCIARGSEGTEARVIGAIAAALHLDSDRNAVEAALVDPATRIVTLTVTEKGYGIDRATGGIDPNHPAVAADLATPDRPSGVAGLLVRALGQRRARGTAPFTVLSCDNLPENGRLTRGLLVDFARQSDPDLAEYIAASVAFPSAMVDRITPAPREATRALAQERTGHTDAAAVECETFRQWVIEDDFPTGRPKWEAGGAQLVPDVRPFEEMKLRMLNGAHSMLAYAGFLAGHSHVRDAMKDAALSALIARHLRHAAATVKGIPPTDLEDYATALMHRFANPHIAHQTYQIAMDGSEKMPQRFFAPALDALQRGTPIDAFAFATAAWMRYTLGVTDKGTPYALRDPREGALAAGADRPDASALMAHITALPGLIPEALAADTDWRQAVEGHLRVMLGNGMAQAIAMAAQNLPQAPQSGI